MKSKTTLRELLGVSWGDIHLVYKDEDMEPCTIVELNEHTLTVQGKEK